MNWLNNLLRKAPEPQSRATAAARRTPVAAARVTADIGPLRAALALATDSEQLRERQMALGVALAGNGQSPTADDPPAVWAAAAGAAGERAQALQWQAQVSGDALLAELAAGARFAEVRLAAALRVQASSVLDALARHSRDKDRGVYRHCTEVLRERRRESLRSQQAQALAGELEAMLATAPLSVSRLLDWEHRLAALGAGVDPLEPCRHQLALANDRIRAEAALRRRLQWLAEAAAAQGAALVAALWPGAEALANARRALEAVRDELAALPVWLRNEAPAGALLARMQALHEELAAMEADLPLVAAAECLLADPDARAEAWDALTLPVHPGARRDLQVRWEMRQHAATGTPVEGGAPAALPPGAAPLETPGPAMPGAVARKKKDAQPRVDPEVLRAQLESLEAALDEGHLAEAEALEHQIKEGLGEQDLKAGPAGRLLRARARLGELRGWAVWGANKKRDDLIEAARQLLDPAHGVDHLAVAIPALREEWKRLNAQGPASKAQWESFDSALEKAYAPVAVVRAEEAQRRAQARAAKESLLGTWEAALLGNADLAPDLTAIAALRQQMIGQWRSAPLAGFRDERTLRKRLDSLIEGIDAQMAAARSAEIGRRQALIEAALALRELDDPRRATSEAKALQERWREAAVSLRLGRGEEQKLWRAFRAACDAIFERRDSLRAEETAHREQRVKMRSALLEAFAASLGQSDTALIKKDLARFRADWDAARSGSEGPDGQDRQAQKLQQQAQQRLAVLQQDAYRARLQALVQPPAPGAPVVGTARVQPLATRGALLIDLEIALGLATPPEAGAARRQRQLEQLQGRFRAGASAPVKPEELLAQYHAAPADPDIQFDERLARIVDRLVQQHARA